MLILVRLIFLSKNVQVLSTQVTAHMNILHRLDSYSIREKLGEVGGKKVVIVGDVLHRE
jgi:aspartate carbamoyltransferase catalytic subunit